MVLSMTGYGKAEGDYNSRHIVVEIKTLNSKQLDLQMRTSSAYRSGEINFRNIVMERLVRGKVDLSVQIDHHYAAQSAAMINESLFEAYKNNICGICERQQIAVPDNLAEIILRMPDIFRQENDEVTDSEWAVVYGLINEAIDYLVAFRQQEGASLRRMFGNKLDNIAGYLAEVEQYEGSRIEHIHRRLEEGITRLAQNKQIDVDRARLEQEMIFYIEKLDINEEKVRLRNHIEYFRHTMDAEDNIGKKLGFIAQEMGREINTLGSKSNQSEMQILVVKMKDELEQIKEQVLNVL